jgi:hypothetical protein
MAMTGWGLAVAAVFLAVASVKATPAVPRPVRGALPETSAYFSVLRHPSYPQPRPLLQTFARSERQRSPRPSRVDHFCVVGYRDTDAAVGEHAWIHWIEGRVLILWEPAADRTHPLPLAASRRILHLDQDVVATEAEVGTSTYRVTRHWAEGIIQDCKRHGDQMVIPFTPATKPRRPAP